MQTSEQNNLMVLVQCCLSTVSKRHVNVFNPIYALILLQSKTGRFLSTGLRERHRDSEKNQNQLYCHKSLHPIQRQKTKTRGTGTGELCKERWKKTMSILLLGAQFDLVKKNRKAKMFFLH